MTAVKKIMQNGTQVYPETSLSAVIGYAGATNNRPTTGLTAGLMYFDTTLGKPIWYNGSKWVDATGSGV